MRDGSSGCLKPLILVVEDDAALATMLCYNLEKQGFRVEEVPDDDDCPRSAEITGGRRSRRIATVIPPGGSITMSKLITTFGTGRGIDNYGRIERAVPLGDWIAVQTELGTRRLCRTANPATMSCAGA